MGPVREFRNANSAPSGAHLAVLSDIEPGAGLSSSAALAVPTRCRARAPCGTRAAS